ncbi:g6319 [Coccomyxa elongata]
MANSSGTSQRASSSEALRSTSSASSLALQGPVEGATRGGQAESSGRGWADLSGDMQQRLNLGQGQQARRSSDSFASIPRVYSNERLAPEHRSGSLSRLAYSSHERLDQLGGLSARQGSSSDMEVRRPDSSPSLHRRGTGSGTEEDIFSAVGGLEIDGEHRCSSVSQGLDSMSHLSSRSQMSAECAAERETRTLVVKNVNPDVSDAEFKQLFEQYGDLRTLYTACKEQGWLMISYWNIIAAKLAKVNMDRQVIHGRQCGVQFAPNKEAKELQEGMVTLTNHNPELSDQDICGMLQAEYGEVYSIMTPPDNPHKRHIEFCDVRHAQAAKQALEGIAAKIPTISEQGTVGVDAPSGMRNVQSMHTFIPQAGPAPGPPPVQQDMRPHSWDNSGGHLSNMAMQSQLLHQLNPQLLASLSSQGIFNQQAGLTSNGSSGNLGGLQAEVDSLMRASYLDPSQGNNAALQVQALLNGSSSSLSGMQGGSHSNLASMSGRGMAPNGSPHRSGSGGGLDPPSALLSAGSQHLSASQLLSLGSGNQQVTSTEQGGNFSRRNASMSTGNLADMYNQPNLLGNGMQSGLRGVASTSNIWDGQGNGSNWGGLSGNANQAALQAQAQALALQLQLAGGLDQGAASYLAGAPNSLTAYAQQQFLQQQLQNLSLQTNLSLQQNTAALLAKVQQQAGALRGLAASGHARKGSRDDLAGGRLSRRVQDPAAEAERKAAQEKMYSLDMDKVAKGEDKRTTLMIKNIPNKYTQKMLLATIDEDFKGHYDFFYLPIDFKNKCNVGYAFINMILPEYIPALFQRFHAKKWEKFNSEKVCHISYARIQGKSSLVTHFQNSSLLHEDKRCRPIIFRTDGNVAGEQEPFPAGPNVRSRPARPGSAGAGPNSLAAAPSLGAVPGGSMANLRHPGAGW